MPTDGAQLAEEIEYCWESIDETGRQLLRAYLETPSFSDNAGLFAGWLSDVLDGKRGPHIDTMNWTDPALGWLLAGACMIQNSSADPMVENWAKKVLTAGVLTASTRLIAPGLEQRRRAEWN